MSDDPEARERLIGNERIKLTAGLLNTLAASCIVAGIIAPVATILYTIQLPVSHYWGLFVLCWGLAALSFHLIARALLKGLIP